MSCSVHSPAPLARLGHACNSLPSPGDQVPESHCGERNGPHPQTAASFGLPLVPRSPHHKAAYLGSDSEPAQCKMSSPWGRFVETILSFQAQGFHLSSDHSCSILYRVLSWPKRIKTNAWAENTKSIKSKTLDFPGSSVVKNLPSNAGDTGLILGMGGSHMPWGN